MTLFQRRLFHQTARILFGVLGGLVLIALLTQGITQLALLVDNRQQLSRYLYVTLLYTPQLIVLVLPIALFLGAVMTLNRRQLDHEFPIMRAAGQSGPWIASPVLRLAVLTALCHLALALFAQPWAARELRAQLFAVRTDLASTLIREGQFTAPRDGLTFYARQVRANGDLRSVIIDDRRDPNQATTYIADSARLSSASARPQISLISGSVQQQGRDGALQIIKFEQFPLDLTPFLDEEGDIIYKAADRYLFELLTPDVTGFYERQNKDKFIAEGHARLAAPFLDLALAALAIWAIIGGEYSRRGYGRRIALAASGALVLRIAAAGLQQAADNAPALNILQYLVPFAVFWFALRAAYKKST